MQMALMTERADTNANEDPERKQSADAKTTGMQDNNRQKEDN